MELVEYKNFGKCAKYERNGVIAMVTLDIGPRIIYYGTKEFNFMNEDQERIVQKSGDFFDNSYKKGEKWCLYGGHRVWKAIEDMETYVPDNYPVECEMTEYGGEFYTQTTPFGLKYGFSFEMRENGALDIINRIFNFGEDREISIWALTVVAKGGKLIVPMNDKVNDLLPSQNFVIWPYCNLKDERLCIEKEKFTLCQTNKEQAFKLGIFSKKNEAFYELNGKTMKFTYQKIDGVFGDFWCNFETYTNAHILEVEGLGAMKTLKKNGVVELAESFEIL